MTKKNIIPNIEHVKFFTSTFHMCTRFYYTLIIKMLKTFYKFNCMSHVNFYQYFTIFIKI